MPESRLLACPEEIVFKIAGEVLKASSQYGSKIEWEEYLEDSDDCDMIYKPPEQPILQLRLVHPVLNRIATPVLAKAWFSERRVILNKHSLEALLKISRHPIFGPAVRTLIIVPECLRDEPVSNWFCRDKEAYFAAVKHQKYMMTSGLNTTYIADALASFSNWENLKAVVIGMDSESDHKRAWGSITLERKVGDQVRRGVFTYENEGVDFTTDTIRAVILAIAKTRISLGRFAIRIDEWDCWRQGNYPEGSYSPIFRREEPLTDYIRDHPLNASSVELSIPKWFHRGQSMIDEWVSDKLEFLGHFNEIRALDLHFEEFISRNNDGPRVEKLFQAISLPHLKTLSLGGFDCYMADLFSFLVVHKVKLQEVHFKDVVLLTGNTDPGFDDWQHLLIRVIKELPSIKKATMRYCKDLRRSNPRCGAYMHQGLYCSKCGPWYQAEWAFGDRGHTEEDIIRDLPKKALRY